MEWEESAFFSFSVLYGDVRRVRVGVQVKGEGSIIILSLGHAAYAVVAVLRVVGVPARSEFPSGSLASL